MRTAAQEAAPQIALRDCSKAAVGEVYIYIKVLVKGELNNIKHSFYKKFVAKPDVTMKGFRAFLDIRRLES